MKDALKNQSRPTRQCACGRGRVYTDNGPGVIRIAGENRCECCKFDQIINDFMNRPKAD